jgi:hypothetical protein
MFFDIDIFEETETAVHNGTIEAKDVGAYVVPDDEYKKSADDGEVVVPVPPYCVAKFVWESTVCPSTRRTPDELVSPAIVSLFFTLKSLSDNSVHYPLIDIG